MNIIRNAFIVVLLALAAGRGVRGAQLDEYGVKGAFVYNFLQFVDWPEDRLPPQSYLTICVFNDSPITQKLGPLGGQSVKGHPIRVRTATALPDLGACHVVILPAAETRRLKEISVRYPGGGLLLISEDQDGDDVDAAINLVVVEKRLTFEINLAAAQAQRVQLSSKLIKLARRVSGTVGPTGGFLFPVPRPVVGGD